MLEHNPHGFYYTLGRPVTSSGKGCSTITTGKSHVVLLLRLINTKNTLIRQIHINIYTATKSYIHMISCYNPE